MEALLVLLLVASAAPQLAASMQTSNNVGLLLEIEASKKQSLLQTARLKCFHLPPADCPTPSIGYCKKRVEANACGNPSYPADTRVVNGVDARPYSWPWQISLEVDRGSYYSHTCGGSLIDSDWVVTAGHCISSGRSYRVVLGEYDRNVDDSSEQTIAAAKIFVHPQWNPSCLSCGNDIALIKLSKPATLNDKVKPACIPPSGDIFENNYPCYVTGWGRLYTGGPLATKLQQALLPVVDHQTCKQSDWWGNSVKTSMVCAGGYEMSGCNGDSGGPLNCRGADGLWYVYGVVSFGSSWGCNTLKKPTVFTRVSAFNSWIDSTMASN